MTQPRFHATVDGPVPFTIDEEREADVREAELLTFAPNRLANEHRSQRDSLLASTDWLVIKAQETGVAMDQAWATYRQALRDITNHVNFPYLADEDWPNKP